MTALFFWNILTGSLIKGRVFSFCLVHPDSDVQIQDDNDDIPTYKSTDEEEKESEEESEEESEDENEGENEREKEEEESEEETMLDESRYPCSTFCIVSMIRNLNFNRKLWTQISFPSFLIKNNLSQAFFGNFYLASLWNAKKTFNWDFHTMRSLLMNYYFL